MQTKPSPKTQAAVKLLTWGRGGGAWRCPGLPFLGPQGPWGPQVMLQRRVSTLFLTRLQTGKDVIVQLSLKRCHLAGGPHQPR